MSIFLRISDRYRAALDTFDPLDNDWLLRIIDPWPSRNPDGKPPWYRFVLLVLILGGPTLCFSAIQSETFGGRLFGKGGLIIDIGAIAIKFFFIFALILIPIIRRVLGDLINELVQRGIAEPNLKNFKEKLASVPVGRVLRSLEYLSRTGGKRGVLLWLTFIVTNIITYYIFLTDGRPTWHTSPAEPGTLFYAFSFGNEQPNLAGIWARFISSPINIYLVILIARLSIVFSVLSNHLAALAKSKDLLIIPTHPDRTGGLLPIGQVALLFALLIFIIGITNVGTTANELVVISIFQPTATHTYTNLQFQYVSWGLYLVLDQCSFFSHSCHYEPRWPRRSDTTYSR